MTRKLLTVLLLIATCIVPASAQFSNGVVLTAAALNAALANPVIVGGSINGSPIGLVNPAAGAFTNLQSTNLVVTSTATINAIVINGVTFGVATGLTSSIGGSALSAGACSSGTVSIANATNTMAVLATPMTYPGDAVAWKSYVSTTGVVTVKVCAMIAATPTSSAYVVRVFQ